MASALSVLDIARGTLAPTEKQVEARGDRLMALLGWDVVRFSQARATQQTPGIPDRRYYHRGRGLTLWWEAKRPGGKQRPAQREFQRMCEACGERYVVGDDAALLAAVRQLAGADSAPGGP